MKKPIFSKALLQQFNRENFKKLFQFLIASFIINLFVELLARRSPNDTVLFIVDSPLLFLYGILIIFFSLSLSLLFKRQRFWFMLFSSVWVALAVTDFILLTFRSMPLTAPDIWLMSSVRDIFEKDDFTLVNLECVLTESTDRVEKTWNLKGKPEYVGIMTGSSVEGCSLGNNHTLDYGPQSLTDTENVLDQAGIVYGYNEHVATYTTESGIVIGIVSANLLAQTQERANYIRDGITKLREEGTDLVIACCHWGIEGDHYPNDYQKTTAHQIIDWGADAVIGNHPHVLQGVELYEGKMICYSLGNFCFGGNRNPQVKDTAIFQQTFTFVDGELQNNISAKMIPCTISSTNSVNDFQPTVASGERKATIIEELNEYSKPYSELQLDAEGTLYLGDKN